ncbi:hypothetical protein K438DRAFT_1767772 [Mycena galopus ATCC 62051]|nr:hypothetical protein K438DRAFT_1767772 [Mycena galopus ATCC 62051]
MARMGAAAEWNHAKKQAAWRRMWKLYPRAVVILKVSIRPNKKTKINESPSRRTSLVRAEESGLKMKKLVSDYAARAAIRILKQRIWVVPEFTKVPTEMDLLKDVGGLDLMRTRWKEGALGRFFLIWVSRETENAKVLYHWVRAREALKAEDSEWKDEIRKTQMRDIKSASSRSEEDARAVQ